MAAVTIASNVRSEGLRQSRTTPTAKAKKDAVWFELPAMDCSGTGPPLDMGQLIVSIMLRQPDRIMSEEAIRLSIETIVWKWHGEKRVGEHEGRSHLTTEKEETRGGIYRAVPKFLERYGFPLIDCAMKVADDIGGFYVSTGYKPNIAMAWHYLQVGPLYDDLRQGNHFPFMQLPAELRLMVYDHYFDHTQCKLSMAGPPTRLYVVPLKGRTGYPMYRDFRRSVALALTQTCRSVREEFSMLLYKLNAIHIDTIWGANGSLRWIAPSHKMHIVHLILGFSPTTRGTGVTFKMLRKLNTLRTLKMTEKASNPSLTTEHVIKNAMLTSPGLRELAKLRGLQSISLPKENEFLEQWLKVKVTQPKRVSNGKKGAKTPST